MQLANVLICADRKHRESCIEHSGRSSLHGFCRPAQRVIHSCQGGAAGEVSGEVRLPYSISRGFRFATTSSGCNPATVQLPQPWFGRSHDTSAVVLDGIEVPQSVAQHHAEAKGMMDPLKNISWEGDNMMILPFYKCVTPPPTAGHYIVKVHILLEQPPAAMRST